MKFKAGDILRALDTFYSIKKGEYYIISKASEEYPGMFYLKEVDDGKVSYGESHFELVEGPKSTDLPTDEIIKLPEYIILDDVGPVDAKTGEGKLDWTLLPYKALKQVVEVLEFGGKKYPRDSWKAKSGDYKNRYLAATQRHLTEILLGNDKDPESGLAHAAHLACNALFLVYFYLDDSYRDNL